MFLYLRDSVRSPDAKRTQRLGPGMLNRGQTWSKTYIDKSFKYVFYEFYTWTKNSRTKCCINISNRNITLHHINFVLSSLEWRRFFLPSIKYRSSLPEVFGKKGVLKNFPKFTEKKLCRSLFFNKFAGLRPATLCKKIHRHRCFPLIFPKVLRTPFFKTALVTASENSVITIRLITLRTVARFYWTNWHLWTEIQILWVT